MGACCSCHTGGRFEYPVEGEDEEREVEHEDIVLRGHAGARVRLQGSSKYVSMFTQQGKKGANQDAMTVWEVIHENNHLLLPFNIYFCIRLLFSLFLLGNVQY